MWSCVCVCYVVVCMPQWVAHIHRSFKTHPPTASVTEGTRDAVILCLRNHGDSPFSDVLCLLASLSKDVRNTETHTCRLKRLVLGKRDVFDGWTADQSRVTDRQTDPGAGFSLSHNVESFKRRPAGCCVFSETCRSFKLGLSFVFNLFQRYAVLKCI